jgi:lipoprotein-anchoring transpeptidase ErfK/SrfK
MQTLTPRSQLTRAPDRMRPFRLYDAFAARRRWLLHLLLTTVTAGLAGCAYFQPKAPFGLSMTPPNGSQSVDPNGPVVVEATGSETRLTRVEAQDSDGKPVNGALDGQRFTLQPPLDYGKTYLIRATLENAALGQVQTRELSFATPAIPRLDGPTRRTLEPDGSVSLHFDRPVGHLDIAGNLKTRIEPDPQHRIFRVAASGYAQGQIVPITLNWATSSGVPLPPLALELTTAPALTAEMNQNNATSLGLALPVQIRFSEALLDPDGAAKRITVHTRGGENVSGQWRWIGDLRLRFTPQPRWPASSEIEVSAEPGAIRTLRGGTVDQPLIGRFSTGAEREIFVYLDAQRVTAVENGKVVRSFRVSTGKPATPTVTGSYYIYARFPLKTMRSQAKPGEPGHYIVENVPYAQYFHEDYALHGAWWHNGFGRPASHGCVNMATRNHNRRWPSAPEDAGWLYQWAALGVPVTVLRKSTTP